MPRTFIYVTHTRLIIKQRKLLRSLRYLYSVITAYQHQWAQLHKDTIGWKSTNEYSSKYICRSPLEMCTSLRVHILSRTVKCMLREKPHKFHLKCRHDESTRPLCAGHHWYFTVRIKPFTYHHRTSQNAGTDKNDVKFAVENHGSLTFTTNIIPTLSAMTLTLRASQITSAVSPLLSSTSTITIWY